MSGSDLFTGTLDLLILRTLRDDAQHGYAIGRALREASEGVLDVAEGVLYPALHRLEERGFLTAEWGPSDTGRRAKYYSLTADGSTRLEADRDDWDAFVTAVGSVLDPGTAQ